jgi:hypothetical protein
MVSVFISVSFTIKTTKKSGFAGLYVVCCVISLHSTKAFRLYKEEIKIKITVWKFHLFKNNNFMLIRKKYFSFDTPQTRQCSPANVRYPMRFLISSSTFLKRWMGL